jgi:hypothetical protein
MPGLSHRRLASISTTVTTVLRGTIKEPLCISVAESECALSSNRLFLYLIGCMCIFASLYQVCGDVEE